MDKTNNDAISQQAELHRTIMKVASAASDSVSLMQEELKKAAEMTDPIITLCKQAGLVDASNEASIRESLMTPSGTSLILKQALTQYVEDIKKLAATKTAAAAESGKPVGRTGFAVDKTASARPTASRATDEDYIGSLGRRFR